MEISAGDVESSGRIAALEMAVRLLIERSADPEQIRNELEASAQALADPMIEDGEMIRVVFGQGVLAGAMALTGRPSI